MSNINLHLPFRLYTLSENLYIAPEKSVGNCCFLYNQLNMRNIELLWPKYLNTKPFLYEKVS